MGCALALIVLCSFCSIVVNGRMGVADEHCFDKMELCRRTMCRSMMLDNCRKTCGLCKPRHSVRLINTEEEVMKKSLKKRYRSRKGKRICKDKYARCKDLSQKGYCSKKKLKLNCKVSCNACSTHSKHSKQFEPSNHNTGGTRTNNSFKLKCKDWSDMCPKFADNGFCTMDDYKEKMRQNCMQSCHLCASKTDDGDSKNDGTIGDTDSPTAKEPSVSDN